MNAPRRALLGALAAGLVSALTPAAASADIYCVNSPGGTCDMNFVADLQAALTMAQTHPGEDTVRLGNGPADRAGGFSYDSPDTLHIEGNGGRFHGGAERTLVRNTTASPSSETVLKVLGNNQSTISGIDVPVPRGPGSNVGIDTTGAIDNVLVHMLSGQGSGFLNKGVVLRGGASLTNSDVLLSFDQETTAVAPQGPSVTIRDVRLTGTGGVVMLVPGSSAVVERANVEFGSIAVSSNAGDISVDDSLLVYAVEGGASAEGLVAFATADDASVVANHVTLIGHAGTTSGHALESISAGSANASVTFRNGVISGFGHRFFRNATSTGTANITTDYSDYAPGIETENGPGMITETNHIDVPPGFASTTYYQLGAGSPLIDVADPAEAGGGDGDGDCVARRDIGAFEYVPGPRAPRAIVSGPFDASGSCDPDGDALTFSWAFDDGATADGAVVQHTFASPGLHFGTVTVTDSTGRSATATTSLTTPPAAFPGVVLKDQRIRASKKRLVKVAVGCPAGTIASCAGTFMLAGRKVTFFYPPGATRYSTVKLTRATFKKLRKMKKLTRTATAVAHDGNGSAHTTTAKITLLRPR